MRRTGRPKTRFTFSLGLALFWIMVILGLYYWVHKPLTPPLASAIGGALLDMLAAFIFTIVGSGLGRYMLRRLDFSCWSTPERLAAAGLVGMSTLSLLVLGVGSIMLNPLSMIVLLIGVALIVARDLVAWMRELLQWLQSGLPDDGWSRFLALTALIMLVIALILALMPPTKWDVLTYHLAGAEQYVDHGRFYAVKHNHFLGFPQLADTLYAGQLALTGRLAGCALLHWVTGVFMLMMAGGYAARRTSSAAGWVAVNTLLIATTIWLEMTFSYADLLPIALSIMGIALVESWQAVRHGIRDVQADSSAASPPTSTTHDLRVGMGYLILLGVVVGFGMSTKYTVLWMGVAFGILVMWMGLRDGWRAAVLFGAVCGIAASITLSPWLLRNAVWYHNPVYPLVFEAAEMDTIRQDWYGRPGSGLIGTSGVWQILIMPVAATFLGVEGGTGFGTDIGPLFLMLAPMLLLSWKHLTIMERVTVRRIMIVVSVVTIIWAFTAAFGSYVSLRTRFVMYMFGPLAVVSGIALESLRRLPKKPLDFRFIVQALVVLTLAFMVIDAVTFLNNSGVQLYFSGDDDYEEDYLEFALGWHYETMRQVNRLPEGSTVRFFWEPRYLYCDNDRLDCYTDSLMDSWYHSRRTVADGSPAAIAASWRPTADYLLVYEFGRNFEKDETDLYTREDWNAWDVFVSDYLVEEWRNGNSAEDIEYILYRWRD